MDTPHSYTIQALELMFPKEEYEHRIKRRFEFNEATKPCLEVDVSSSDTLKLIVEAGNEVSFIWH